MPAPTMPTALPTVPPSPTTRPRIRAALARTEARRMLRHPALPVGLVLTALTARNVAEADWSGARYGGYVAALCGLLWGVSVAAASAGGRTRTPLAEEAPVGAADRVHARALAGTALVGVVAAVVLAGAVWLRLTGGLDLGDEPGRTAHAHHTLPELLQPVALAAFAVALGMVVGSRARRRLEALVAVTVLWFAVGGLYWLFNTPQLQPLALIQVMPLRVPVGPASTIPQSFPPDWLLSRPGQYQEGWVRLVVSPEIAAWHDAYLVGLTVLLLAVLLPGRPRRVLAVAGAVLAVAGVVVQYALMQGLVPDGIVP